MNARIWKFVVSLLVLALLIGGGAMLYRAGYAQGAMADVAFDTLPQANGETAQYMPYYGMHRGYHGHMGFFFFGRFFFGMLFFFLFFGAIFRFFGMRRYWEMHGMKGGGRHWRGRGSHQHGGPCNENEEMSEESKDDTDNVEEETEA